MNWEVIRAGLFDELAKIAAVDLRGLSPETVLAQQPPEPMMTEGYNKAKAILDRAQLVKTSASRELQRALPTKVGLQKMVHQGDDSTPERVKSVAGYGMAGLGTAGALDKVYQSMPGVFAAKEQMDPAGRAAARIAANNVTRRSLLTGAALGTAYGIHRIHKKAKDARAAAMTKVSTLGSPGIQLKATQQVAKPSMAPSVSGPSINSQIGGSLIGRKGVPGAGT